MARRFTAIWCKGVYILSYAFIGFGTIGKTVEQLLWENKALYSRNGLHTVSFDSDKSTPVSLSPGAFGSHTIDLSFDGQDVATAMKNGKFAGFPFISPSFIKTYSPDSAMGLQPRIGYVASTVHQATIRNSVQKLVEMSASGGELTVIRAFSSFGGTSRGAANEVNEFLWDISRSTGIRIRVQDIVAIPGSATSSSSFHRIYQRNTYAFIKEISALRTGRCHRLLYDDDGNPSGERHEFLPHSLVLVNDVHKELGVLSLEQLLRNMTRSVEVITREEFSPHFHGVMSDLEQHETTVPYADRMGVNSLFIPNKEELLARRLRTTVEVLTRVQESRTDHSALARGLVEGIGLLAPEVEQLGIYRQAQEELRDHWGMDPIAKFRELYPTSPDEYFFQYESMAELIESVNTEEIDIRVRDGILTQGVMDDQVRALRKKSPPKGIPTAQDTAQSVIEKEHKDIEASVCGDDARIYALIEEHEDNANQASREFKKTRRRKRREDALSEVKSNLLSALQLRVKGALLRILAAVMFGVLEAIAQDEIEIWTETRKEAQNMAQALADLREEQISHCNSLKEDKCLRGNSQQVERRGGIKMGSPMNDGLAESIQTGLYSVIERMYGRPYEAIKREVLSYIRGRVDSLQVDAERLTSRHVTQDMFTDALKCALPLQAVDMTSNTHRRAVFCNSPFQCRDMMQRAIADTGIRVAKDVFLRPRGMNDELVILIYDRGVPLGSMRSVQECRIQYRSDDERYKGHLEPLLELLPDPIDDSDRAAGGSRYLLMGIISGCVRKTQDRYVYLEEGRSNTVDAGNVSFFAEYERAVEFASRFIVNLRKFGFDTAIKRLENAKTTEDFHDAAPELLSSLERYAEIYQNGSS